MKGLLYKDIRLAKGALIFLAVMQLLVSVCMSVFEMLIDTNLASVINVMCCYLMFVLVSIINSEMFRGDERRVWHHFVMASPKLGRGQVTSKYLVVAMLHGMVLAICVLTSALGDLIQNQKISSVWTAMVMLCGLQLCLQALELPFVIRYVKEAGAKIKGFFLLAIITIIVLYGLYGDISIFLEKDIFAKIMEYVSSHKAIWHMGVIAGISAVVYGISYVISVRLYRGSVENYEQ